MRRLTIRTKRWLVIIGIILLLGVISYGMLYWYIMDSLHPKVISKFKPSAHFLSADPAHGATMHSLQPISIHFDYPLTKLSTISITAGDWEDGTAKIRLSDHNTTMNTMLRPAVKNAIYTVNYTACFIDNYCDYGYFQFRLNRP